MKVSKTLLLVLSVALLLTPSQLNAQAPDEQAAADQVGDDQAAAGDVGRFSGEITVTAQKREEALIEVPISIRAVTSDELETINAQELSDIARLVPSMSMTDLSRGGNNVQIRGLGSNVGNVGTVAMYNDGIISATRTQSDGTFAEQDPTLFDVERVEVLRGPQGTLYGEGSFGGVINFISSRPDPSKFSASFSGDYFSIKDGDSSNYNAAAMVNIPLAKDRWALRLVGHTRDRGGYVDSVDVLPLFFGMPAQPAGDDTNTEKFYAGRMLLGYTGDKVFANLIVKTQKTELGESNFSSPRLIGMVNDLTGSNFDPELSLAVFGGPLSDTESTTNEAVLDINVVTPVGLFTSITGYGEVESEFFIDPGTLSQNEAFSQEFRLSSESSASINYTFGAYYRDAERLFELGHGGGIPFGFTSMEQWSVYGQLYWDISEVVRATLGLSYSEFESQVRDDLLGLPTAKGTYDDVSPKISFAWQPNETVNAYVSAAKGFRAGGANIDESLGMDPRYVEVFEPDEIWNYELGLKKIFADGRVALNTAVFYIDWSNIQIDRPIASLVTPPVQFIVTNGEDAHSTGIEADLYWGPGRGWEIVLGGSYMEPEYDSGTIDSVSGPFELKGQTLPSAPRELWNASITKNVPLGNQGLNGFVRLDYMHRGNSFADVPNERPGTDLNSREFDLLNLRLGVNQDSWEFQVFAKNLTNEDASAWNFEDVNLIDSFTSLRARIAPLTIGINIKFFYN